MFVAHGAESMNSYYRYATTTRNQYEVHVLIKAFYDIAGNFWFCTRYTELRKNFVHICAYLLVLHFNLSDNFDI